MSILKKINWFYVVTVIVTSLLFYTIGFMNGNDSLLLALEKCEDRDMAMWVAGEITELDVAQDMDYPTGYGANYLAVDNYRRTMIFDCYMKEIGR